MQSKSKVLSGRYETPSGAEEKVNTGPYIDIRKPSLVIGVGYFKKTSCHHGNPSRSCSFLRTSTGVTEASGSIFKP